ncbi:MAG: type I pullulanase [Bacteroidota bacterium]
MSLLTAMLLTACICAQTEWPVYTKNDLGLRYSEEMSTFRVWAPSADEVDIIIYESTKDSSGTITKMKRGEFGTWTAVIKGDLANRYYVYSVSKNGEVKTTADPYSTALSKNSRRSLILNMHNTDPAGWQSQKIPELEKATDAVIYEVHIRDFSADGNSGMNGKGKYLAFAENGTQGPGGESTGVEHLKELGITHVQLLPVYDFGSVDENRPDEYSWGYDPEYFNVPEGSYSTDPDNSSRITEFKKMVMNLHNNGIGVIMDVVYNHTFRTGVSAFDILAPKYFYRLDSAGNYSNASGCGNEMATDKPMVRSFIINSLKHWVSEYKIDGFRFDLLGAVDLETMKQIVRELRSISPQIILYGEPWAPGTTPLKDNERVLKGNQKNLGFAVFNDNIRDAIKGDTQGSRPGFVQGVDTLKEAVKRGIEGSINDFTDSPSETINYVSCHDDLCHWDKLFKSSAGSDTADIIRMSKLSNGIVMTSQGIAFLHGGEEFARTKYGEHNTFNKGDRYNKFIYSNKLKYPGLFSYYKGLIELRKNHPSFRLGSAEEVRKTLSFFDTPKGTIGYILDNRNNNDKWKQIIVLYNTNRHTENIILPHSGNWKVAANEIEAGDRQVQKGTGEVKGNIAEVAAVSMMVLYSE